MPWCRNAGMQEADSCSNMLQMGISTLIAFSAAIHDRACELSGAIKAAFSWGRRCPAQQPGGRAQPPTVQRTTPSIRKVQVVTAVHLLLLVSTLMVATNTFMQRINLTNDSPDLTPIPLNAAYSPPCAAEPQL